MLATAGLRPFIYIIGYALHHKIIIIVMGGGWMMMRWWIISK